MHYMGVFTSISSALPLLHLSSHRFIHPMHAFPIVIPTCAYLHYTEDGPKMIMSPNKQAYQILR